VTRGALISSLIVGISGAARAAHADPLPVDLTWDAPPECPTQSDVLTELARITRVKSGRVVTRVSAQAKIERANNGRYELHLRTERQDQTGDTDLDAATCSVLKRGVTLVLALALGDGVDLIDDKAEATAEPGDAVPTAASPTAPLAAPPITPRAPQQKMTTPLDGSSERANAAARALVHWAPWVGAAGASGLVGKPSLGAQLGLTLAERHWAAFAHSDAWPSESTHDTAGVAAKYRAFFGSLGGCLRAPLGAASLAGCAHFDLGVVHGSSSGAFQDGSATAPFYAVGPSLVFLAPLAGPLQLRVEAGADVSLDPPHFALRSFGEVYAVARVVPLLSVGVAFDMR
jgi:hypothetical protein